MFRRPLQTKKNKRSKSQYNCLKDGNSSISYATAVNNDVKITWNQKLSNDLKDFLRRSAFVKLEKN